ncbi:MAG: WbqC family protein [Candidatus Helarchaeota archaeon]
MILSIIQPSFIPWRGYFNIIGRSDIFVFLDDVQYEKGSWRNRNKIKTHNGLQWITVPVLTKGMLEQNVNEVLINNKTNWPKKILSSVYFAYKKAPFFYRYYNWFEKILLQPWEMLCDLDISMTKQIAGFLTIQTDFVKSSQLRVPLELKGVDRILYICQKLKAKQYISGPRAKAYLGDGSSFAQKGIELIYQQYNYPEYPQLHGAFEPAVSIIDLLFNCGDESRKYIWSK